MLGESLCVCLHGAQEAAAQELYIILRLGRLLPVPKPQELVLYVATGHRTQRHGHGKHRAEPSENGYTQSKALVLQCYIFLWIKPPVSHILGKHIPTAPYL